MRSADHDLGRALARPRPPRFRLLVVLVGLAVLVGGACRATARPPPVPEVTGPVVSAPANRLGVKWDWARVDSFAPYLRQMAGGTTFFELVWCEVQPDAGATFRWEPVDAVVAGAATLGFTLALKVRTGTCWATDGRGGKARGQREKTASAYPADEAAYDRFVTAAVERYAPRGVHLWAVENEVNAANFWDGSAEDYDRLARRAAPAIRSADPEADVVDFGLSSTGWGTAVASDLLDQGRGDAAVVAWTAWFARRDRPDFPPVASPAELSSALAGAQARRNLAMFEVARRLAADGVVDGTQVHFYEAPGNVPALVELFRRRFGPEGRMEAWEVGRFERRPAGEGPEPDRAEEAGEALKSVVGLLAGGARRVLWLPAAVNPAGRNADEPRAGLLDPDGTVRPAGSALAVLAAATAINGELVALPAGGRLEGAVLAAPDGPALLVAWARSGPVRVPSAGIVARLAPPGSLADGTVEIGPSPVALEVPAGLAAALSLATA